MPIVEDAKRAVEKVTGIGRPKRRDLTELVKPVRPRAFHFRDDGTIPNNEFLALLVYRSAVRLPPAFDPAAVFEELFASRGWKASWRDGIYPFDHFHTKTHEVLGIARGHVCIRFGGKRGRIVELRAGDVAVLPAGTAHKRHSASRDLLVVGAYPTNGGEYDEPKPSEINHDDAVKSIRQVKRPRTDPVYGAKGPLRSLWPPR